MKAGVNGNFGRVKVLKQRKVLILFLGPLRLEFKLFRR